MIADPKTLYDDTAFDFSHEIALHEKFRHGATADEIVHILIDAYYSNVGTDPTLPELYILEHYARDAFRRPDDYAYKYEAVYHRMVQELANTAHTIDKMPLGSIFTAEYHRKEDSPELAIIACMCAGLAECYVQERDENVKSPSRKAVKKPAKTPARSKSKPTILNGKRARMTKTNHYKGGVVTTRKDKIAKQKQKPKAATRSRGAF